MRHSYTRRSFTKLACLNTIGIAAASLLGACGNSHTNANSSNSNTLTIYVGSEPESGFDPITGWGYNGSYILFQSRLLKFDVNLELQPDLATSYTVSDDGLTYTFTLRDDVCFSDGSPFTAEDVVFTYLTARDGGASMLDLTKLESAEALDDLTVQFTLSEAYSSFASITGKLGIVPAALYDEETYRSEPVGTGPFTLLQWNAGQQIIIAPNEYYYGTISSFEQITLLFLDGETALTNAQSGQLDVVMVNPEYATSQVAGMQLQTCPTIAARGFMLPTAALGTASEGNPIGSDVTCDIAVRKALSIGVSRQNIVDNALNGIGTPTTALITNVAWTNDACSYEDGRSEEAIALLEDAGWIEGSDGIREKDGVRAEFTITGRTDDMQRYNLAVAFAEEAGKLGIKINAESALWADCKANSETIPTCWGTGDYDPSGDLCGYYQTGASYNHSQYSNKTVDGYIHAALNTTDMSEAIENWKLAQWDGETGPESENGDLPMIWLATIDHTYFVRDGLSLGEQIVHPHGHGWPIVENLNEWKWA